MGTYEVNYTLVGFNTPQYVGYIAPLGMWNKTSAKHGVYNTMGMGLLIQSDYTVPVQSIERGLNGLMASVALLPSLTACCTCISLVAFSHISLPFCYHFL